MKIDPDLKRRKTFCNKCLARDIKLSSFLGGNPTKFLIFIVNLILLKLVCLKFSFNFV